MAVVHHRLPRPLHKVRVGSTVWTIWALVLGTVTGLIVLSMLLGPGLLAALLSAVLGLVCAAVTSRRTQAEGPTLALPSPEGPQRSD